MLSMKIRYMLHARRYLQHSSFPRVESRRLISAFAEDEYIVVQPDESGKSRWRFPAVWLRDNCRCAQCFHQSSQSRRVDWDAFDTKVKVQTITPNGSPESITIRWSDGHSSTFEMEWLQQREFTTDRRTRYLTKFYRPKPVHWRGTNFSTITKTFNYNDVLEWDGALKDWLESLAVYGVAIIKDSPLEKNVVRTLADRVGFIRKTTYGEEFIVQSKPGAKNYAYLSDPLPLHTDLPYYEYKPSVNILHCLVQSLSKGGSNMLVDAFHIADRLKDEHPEDFKILCETMVDWNDIGSEGGHQFHNIWRSPVICLDNEGAYTRINHSIPQRDSHFSVDIEQVIPWYNAYSKFVRMAKADAVEFKTNPGDVLTFNNIRLFHGRTGYDDTDDNVRYIVGAYLDWDIIYSKLRVLKTKSESW